MLRMVRHVQTFYFNGLTRVLIHSHPGSAHKVWAIDFPLGSIDNPVVYD